MASSTSVDATADTVTVAGRPGAPSGPPTSGSGGGSNPAGSENEAVNEEAAPLETGSGKTRSDEAGSGTQVNKTKVSNASPGVASGSTEAPATDSALRPAGAERSAAAAVDEPSSALPECLSDDVILLYRQGELSRQQLDRIDAHLDTCEPCRELVELVIADEPDAAPGSVGMTTFQRGFLVAERYQIQHFVGKGGMGEVYAAADQMTGRLVALKTVVCTAADDARAVRKLLDEVVNAQRVAHPNVFKIYDLHEHRDARRGRVPFFTMEFIEGESLGARLRRERPLSAPEARAIARQLLAGLSAAHAKGVLHLDFKSDNVMLRGPGAEAVIMDFGLSRASDVQSRQRTSERLQAAGTLPYMSLEQLECRSDLGPPSDVYSFGVVLYEMLTGHLPFQGNTLSAILLRQLREQPIPPSRYVSISPQLEAFLSKCLARSPCDRYADATLALAALEDISSWQRLPQPSPLRRARRLAAAAVVLGGAALVSHAVTRASPPRGARASSAEAAATAPVAPPRATPGGARATDGATPARTAPPLPDASSARSSPATGDADSRSTGDVGAPALPNGPDRLHPLPTPRPKARTGVAAAGLLPPPPQRPPAAAPLQPAPPQRERAVPHTPSDWHGPPPKQVPKPRPL